MYGLEYRKLKTNCYKSLQYERTDKIQFKQHTLKPTLILVKLLNFLKKHFILKKLNINK